MKTERRNETAAMLDALQPLIGEKATAETSTPRVSRTPIIPPPPPRTTPGSVPSLPRVILPDESDEGDAAEVHSHRRVERIIYGAAGVLLTVSVVLLLTAKPRQLADGRPSTSSSPVSSAPAEEVAESARLEIGGRLPDSAVITANGRPLTERAISLAPGRYVLTASAPGYASASDTVTLAERRTVIWSPQLVKAR